MLEPVEALLAHSCRQDGDAAATENARDCYAAAAVVARRRPGCFGVGWIEVAGDDAGHQAAISCQNLVSSDQRKTAAQGHYDSGLDAGEILGEVQVAGNIDAPAALFVVKPMKTPKVGRMRSIRVDVGQ